MGGEDTALINAVSNTLTNLPGFVVPLLGVALRRLSGSLLPLFVCASAFQLATGGAFVSTVLSILHRCDERTPRPKGCGDGRRRWLRCGRRASCWRSETHEDDVSGTTRPCHSTGAGTGVVMRFWALPNRPQASGRSATH